MSEKEHDSKLKATKGYFRNGLPYMRIGNSPRILVVFEGLSFENTPPSGFRLRMNVSSYKRIAQEYTVYVVGLKPSPPLGYSMRDMSEDYATLIRDELGGPVDVMGLSTGGSIAQHFGADHPELVRRLVLASTGYTLSENGRKLQMHVGDLARQGKWRAAYSAIMDGVYPKGGIKKRFLKLFMWFIARAPADPSDLLVTIEAEDKHDFKDRLAEIKVPTLVIGGEEDFFYPIRETAAGIPDAELIVYEGFGHNAWLDNSRQFQEDILAFLK